MKTVKKPSSKPLHRVREVQVVRSGKRRFTLEASIFFKVGVGLLVVAAVLNSFEHEGAAEEIAGLSFIIFIIGTIYLMLAKVIARLITRKRVASQKNTR